MLPPILANLLPGSDIITHSIIIAITTIIVGLMVGGLIGVIQGTLVAYLVSERKPANFCKFEAGEKFNRKNT